MDARVFIVPAVTEIRRVVAVHERLHGADCLAVILLAEGLPAELQIFCLRQMNGVKAFGNYAHVVKPDLHALYIRGRTGRFIPLRQPHGNRLAAQRLHAHEHPPHVAADLFAVWKIIRRAFAPLDDAQALRLADCLHENGLNIGHVNRLLSQFAIFCAVGNEKRDRHRLFQIFARMDSKLPVKRPCEGIHVGKARVERHIDDLRPSVAQLPRRLREAIFADVFRRRQPQIRPEQPVGIPRRKQRRARKIAQADFLRPVLFDVVLHPLDRENLLFHVLIS